MQAGFVVVVLAGEAEVAGACVGPAQSGGAEGVGPGLPDDPLLVIGHGLEFVLISFFVYS